MKQPTLKEMGYPSEGIIEVCWNGDPDRCQELPQEALSPHTCGWCRLFNGDYCTKLWNNAEEDYCDPDRDEKDPDVDTCDDIDYIEEWLDTEYGYRSPVRCEYSSDEMYKQACEAIKLINMGINDDYQDQVDWDYKAHENPY